ncbi:hypothetical protein D3C85_174540 [compost metagenome]
MSRSQHSVDVLIFSDVVRRIREVQVFRNRLLIDDVSQLQRFDLRNRNIHRRNRQTHTELGVTVSSKVDRMIPLTTVAVFVSTVRDLKRGVLQRFFYNVFTVSIHVLNVDVSRVQVHVTIATSVMITLTNGRPVQ